MTKQEFLSLKANYQSLELIRQEAALYYGGIVGEAKTPEPEFHFWNTIAASLMEHLRLPLSARQICKWEPERILQSIEAAQKRGFRKEIAIPFN